MHRGSTRKWLISWKSSLASWIYLEGFCTKLFVQNLLDMILEGFGTKPFWLFPVKVWYQTFCTKPFSLFTKKKFHTKPSFYETKKESSCVPVGKSFFGFIKNLFFRVKKMSYILTTNPFWKQNIYEAKRLLYDR
jgi:hypothetical protein